MAMMKSSIEYEGDVAELNRKPVTAALLAGLLRPSRGDVNMVSAPAILAEVGRETHRNEVASLTGL